VRPGRHQPDADERDSRRPEQRCHDAVKLALKTAIASGGLGQHRGAPVTVVVTTTLAELEQAARAACDPAVPMPPAARTGGIGRIPMRDLIRMAAESIHYLAVFDDHSERPLYLGRTRDWRTADQRIICHARDRGCTKPDCFVPGYDCEVHHARDWSAADPPTRTTSTSAAAATTAPRPTAPTPPPSPTTAGSPGRTDRTTARQRRPPSRAITPRRDDG